MKLFATLLPLLLLSVPSAVASITSSPTLESELSLAEWQLSKTHRMVLRAKRHGRTRKEQVFRRREKRLKEEIHHLKDEITEQGSQGDEAVRPAGNNSSRIATSSQEVTKETVTPSKKSTSVDQSATSTVASTTSVARPVSNLALSLKKGVGFERLVDLNPLAPSLSWCYNWNSKLFEKNGSHPKGTQFVPMLWKPDTDHLAEWEQNVEYWRGQDKGLTHILGFNEPDLDTQANMTVQETLDGWEYHMQGFAKGPKPLKLVSPAVTNGAAPMGLTFLEEFMAGAKARGFVVDAIALHWYDSPTNFEYFKNHLIDAHDRFGLPIWLTEYGFNSGTEQEKIDFHKKMVPWMNDQECIERYAAFGDFVGTFVDDKGGVLPLGTAYESA